MNKRVWHGPLAGALFSCSALLVGCGGGASGPSTIPTGVGASGGSAPITFSIKWPVRANAAGARRPGFISPSTQSVTISLDGTVLATLNAPPPGTPTSSFTVTVPLGNDDFTMKTFDQTAAGGTLLGQVNVQAVIVPATNNVVLLAVEGIVSSVTLAPEPHQPMLEGDATTGYTLLGNRGALFSIVAKDPDGNVILADLPPVTTINNSGIAVGLPSGLPGDIYFLPVGETAGYIQVAGQFNNADGSTFPIPPVKMRSQSLIAVANAGSGGIGLFHEDGTPVAMPTGSFSGLTQPSALIYNYCLGAFIVADESANDLFMYDSDGTTYPYAIGPFPALSHPVGLLEDILANQSYFVANAGDNTVRSYYLTGTAFTPSALGSFQPSAIACINSCLDMLYASATSNAIEEWSGSAQVALANGAFPGLDQPSALLTTYDLFPGAKYVYVANRGDNTIKVFDWSGNPVAVSGSFPGLSSPSSLSWGANGAILVTNAGNNTVTSYDIQGDPIPFPPGAFPGLDQPSSIFFESEGQCYG